jgi:large subunit ribosomal protein L23
MITEKTMDQASKGWYTFMVRFGARKETIVGDIKGLYAVDVTEIRTMSRNGKLRRAGKKMRLVQRSDWKKAVVRLAEGQKIPVFEVPEETK